MNNSFIYLLISFFLYLFICLIIYLFVWLFIYLFIYLSDYLFIYLFIYLLFIQLSKICIFHRSINIFALYIFFYVQVLLLRWNQKYICIEQNVANIILGNLKHLLPLNKKIVMAMKVWYIVCILFSLLIIFYLLFIC